MKVVKDGRSMSIGPRQIFTVMVSAILSLSILMAVPHAGLSAIGVVSLFVLWRACCSQLHEICRLERRPSHEAHDQFQVNVSSDDLAGSDVFRGVWAWLYL